MIQDRPGTPLSNVCSALVEHQLDTTVVRLYGEFDLSSEDRFREELDSLLAGRTQTLVVDLRELTFMDSTGLRALLALHNLSSEEEFSYTLLCDGGSVRRVLRETGLDAVLPVVDAGS